MSTNSLTWDTLPGESSTQLADAADALGRITYRIDRASNDGEQTDYGLDELHEDLQEVENLIQEARRAVGGAL